MNDYIRNLEASQMKESVDEFNVGDTVKVHNRIKEGNKERIQIFEVNSKGELAGAFAFGGANVQADRLRADGIEVENDRVDLKKYGMKN